MSTYGNKTKMSPLLVLLVALLLSASGTLPSEAHSARGHHALKSKTFLSPAILLRPGSVSNKYYFDIAFPRGHIALKSFNGEVVDERGVPVPLHEAYLHHWLVEPYYAPKDAADEAKNLSKIIPDRNSGVCRDTLRQYYGLGSETRHTATWVPDPYGVEAGDPAAPPEGYEERWLLNVHAIDTRGVADRLGCTECRCDLYNVTVDEDGRRIGKGYAGGLRCCYDQTRCKAVKERLGHVDVMTRKVFLRYTVTWLHWSSKVLPVEIYIFDATDKALLQGKSEPACHVEYQVEECSPEKRAKNDCFHVQMAKQVVPRGGDIVYASGHQHAGGLGTSLHGEDGRLLCESIPTYGEGQEAGNEAGYIVGMSTCYPKPGTVAVRDGEVLTVVSNYSSEQRHTGVMGLFYILVAKHGQQ